MNKQGSYKLLVQKRKAFRFMEGLHNPSETPFDVDEIEPWAQWQNNLDAKIMVIGQEFCDIKTYIDTEGKVERYPGKYEYESNKNLHEYLMSLGFDIGHPTQPDRSQPIFLTNAVMGLKDGNMSANFKDTWLNESRENFLIPLIRIIEPKIIITMGEKATRSVGQIFNFKYTGMKKMVESSPIKNGETTVFPVFHSGGLGIRNRNKELQKQDWLKIKTYL